ncbi:galactose ABC transporter substrate-binding protein [Caproicibacter fermentans]|uniref:D-galactose/methyl-galactoside binding periplasmic protein MglB n=1 Tax=Caproicibacter fermentans TaxID=2576756 RepID=A0A7G8TBM6_9FIRM|nr:galactose ABC transporter substrate-binding protein [Caproicibacter fermentans]QNK41017.1 galactose ABC transporter substrate-binding protein [Caproicibacter fermentans]
MRSWKRAVVCILTVLSGMLGSCASGSVPIKTIKIGVTIYRKDDTFIQSVDTYLESEVKKKEAESGKKIVLNIADSQSSQAVQDDQVDRFLSKNYSVICVNMVDRTVASTIINKAKKANIPVVFFNREPVEEDVRMWNKVYYVGADAAQSGTIQGKIIDNVFHENPDLIDRNKDGKIQYVMLEGEQGHQDALLRTEYSIKYLIESGIQVEKLANDTANWQRAQATAKMTQWIKQYGDRIEVVFSNNDDMALGAIDAIQGSSLKRAPVVVGVDGTQPGLEAVKDGSMLGTVYNDAKKQADAIMDLSYALACGQKIPETVELKNQHYVYIPYQMITKQNLKDYE